MQPILRESTASDLSEIEALYPDAFPEENLLPLVRNLHGSPAVAGSFVGEIADRIVAHIVFTRCSLPDEPDAVMLLGPLVVAADKHGQGIGSAMVEHGVKQLQANNACVVCVLGDPEYYGRFGFSTESHVMPPHPLNAEWKNAWQSLKLNDVTKRYTGQLKVSPEWDDPALWS